MTITTVKLLLVKVVCTSFVKVFPVKFLPYAQLKVSVYYAYNIVT